NNQSNRLSGLGRREEALVAIDEAVTLYRQLAAARPDAFTPNLASSLNNQSNVLGDLGRRDEALAAIAEAVTTRRQLAADRPAPFPPDLLRSLNNQSNRLSELGRQEEALAAIDEGARMMLPRLEAAPYLLPDAGERLLRRYVEACEATN